MVFVQRVYGAHLYLAFTVFTLGMSSNACYANNMSLDKHHEYTSDLVKNQSWKPGSAYIETAYRKVSQLNDYVFESNMTAMVKKRISRNGGKFYFKKSKRLRIEVKSKGRNNGAVVVKKSDGTIRGAGGGMLKFIKMNLQPNSRMLILPNGYNVVQSDFKSLFKKLQGKLKLGSKAKVTANSVYSYKWSGKVRVVDITKGQLLTDRILVSAANTVPVEWDTYKNGKLFSISLFKNFRKNTGLSDNLFKL